jgi:hypothetical protein
MDTSVTSFDCWQESGVCIIQMKYSHVSPTSMPRPVSGSRGGVVGVVGLAFAEVFDTPTGAEPGMRGRLAIEGICGNGADGGGAGGPRPTNGMPKSSSGSTALERGLLVFLTDGGDVSHDAAEMACCCTSDKR